VTITVTAPNQSPAVSLVSPVNNAVIPANSTITVEANAEDSDGTITEVKFYSGSTLLGSVTASPFTYEWTTVSPGTYSITAVATDNGGLTTTSTAVLITVNDPTGVQGQVTRVRLHPNPSNSAFRLMPYAPVKTMRVINLYGEEVMAISDIASGQETELGEMLESGTYVLHIEYTSRTFEIIKLVKMK
jgi:uncharacterized protein (DUF2141 family)